MSQYIRSGSADNNYPDGLGHPESACACHRAVPTGDVFEFRVSSLLPWALLAGVAWIFLKSPEARGHAYSTGRSELGRAHTATSSAISRYRSSRARAKTKKRYRR
jgi:hypothetical protein